MYFHEEDEFLGWVEVDGIMHGQIRQDGEIKLICPCPHCGGIGLEIPDYYVRDDICHFAPYFSYEKEEYNYGKDLVEFNQIAAELEEFIDESSEDLERKN